MMLTPEQIAAIKEYIDAKVAYGIAEAFQRDDLFASIRLREAETKLNEALSKPSTY